MIFGVLALAAALALPAEAPPREVLILGIGNDTCGRWMTSRRDPEDKNFVGAWLGGYLTGANVYGNGSGKAGENIQFRDYEIWMTNYCSSHTLDSIKTAADALIKELEARHSK